METTEISFGGETVKNAIRRFSSYLDLAHPNKPLSLSLVGDDIPPWPGCEIELGSETCGKLRNALCQWRGGANKRLGSPPGFPA